MKIHVLTLMLIVILFPKDAFASSAEERLLGKAAIAFVLILVWWFGSSIVKRVQAEKSRKWRESNPGLTGVNKYFTGKSDNKKQLPIINVENRPLIQKIIKDLENDPSMSRTDYSWLKTTSGGNKEIEIAVLYMQEKGIRIIADNLIRRFKTARTTAALDNNRFQEELERACAELGHEEFHLALLLFFSPSLNSSESIYLKSSEARNIYFQCFQQILQSRGITLEQLKGSYRKKVKFRHLLPLKEKI